MVGSHVVVLGWYNGGHHRCFLLRRCSHGSCSGFSRSDANALPVTNLAKKLLPFQSLHLDHLDWSKIPKGIAWLNHCILIFLVSWYKSFCKIKSRKFGLRDLDQYGEMFPFP
ncbi:hypothetical protein P8452_51732 [Trifolium repens]|nr:hypothetical protein P8452_51732 [Trifolium repens]